jgi:Tol biopolymer transport system component
VTSPRGDAPNQQRNGLWTVPIDGGVPARIYETDCCVGYGLPWSLSWSPDSEWIAFGVEVTGKPSESGVVLLRHDGSDVRYATGPAMEPVWQPIPND